MLTFPVPLPSRKELESQYAGHRDQYERMLVRLEDRVRETLRAADLRATVKTRVKRFPSLYQKLLRAHRSAVSDVTELVITDLIGLRIVCPFVEDVARAEAQIRSRFEIREVERKGAEFAVSEFGYESVHILLCVPEDVLAHAGLVGPFDAELQLRTTLQDAWAEVEHELVYKADTTAFDESVRRKLAALNANLTLADITFQEIREYQRKLHGELQERRKSLWHAVADATEGVVQDADLQSMLSEEPPALGVSQARAASSPSPSPSAAALGDGERNLDQALLAALQAHNAGEFQVADQIYTQILDKAPRPYVRAIILIHRGLARFVGRSYQDALADFADALSIDPENQRALYYCGVVYRVLGDVAAAEERFNTCLAADPYQVECLLQRAGLYLQLERDEQALADCDAALAIEPSSQSASALRDRIFQRRAYRSGG